MTNITKKSAGHARTANPTKSEVREQTPLRVAPRLKGKVKNVGIKPKKKSPKKA